MTLRKTIIPAKLKAGDRVRFVSPASPADRDEVEKRAHALEAFGFRVDFGQYAFDRYRYLAGTDEQRLADLNAAYRDPDTRAIFATRGGKGSYRIADQLDFDAVRRDPKPLVGFSDITALHLSLFKNCDLMGIHGALFGNGQDGSDPDNGDALRRMLCETGHLDIATRHGEATAMLTTSGRAEGPLVGGNLDLVVTLAGWALPDLNGAILFLEAVDCYPGHVDRALTMLVKGGHLAGIAGVAVGQFEMVEPKRANIIMEMVRNHLLGLKVPVLGGLPVGHGERSSSLPIGTRAELDADTGILRVHY